MKKTLTVVLFQLFSFCLFCNDITQFSDISELTKYNYNYFSGECVYTGGSEESVYIWKLNKGIIIPRKDLLIDKDGFCYFIYDDELQIVLNGSKFFHAVAPGTWATIDTINRNDFSNAYDFINEIKKDTDVRKFYTASRYGVNKISESSAYSEQLKKGKEVYTAKYLDFFEYQEYGGFKILQHNPWVPGKEKNSSGIGEYLEIEFAKTKDNIVVLNGFVDFDKRHLYKANNRVKKAVITSLDENTPFEIEYDFEDYVHFSEINFPKAVNKVRFTIKEVYKGDKWDDTCITAVITRWKE